MRPGPARKDPKLVALEGNRGKRNRPDEPVQVNQATQGAPQCPKWLHEYAKEEWKRVTPMLVDNGMINKLDMAVMAAYCQSVARWRQADECIDNMTKACMDEKSDDYTGQPGFFTPAGDGDTVHPAVKISQKEREMIVKFCEQLGLTPPARQKFHVPLQQNAKNNEGIGQYLD